MKIFAHELNIHTHTPKYIKTTLKDLEKETRMNREIFRWKSMVGTYKTLI